MPKIEKIFKGLGVFLIGTGLLFNPILLEKIFISNTLSLSLTAIGAIVFSELVIIIIGLLLLLRTKFVIEKKKELLLLISTVLFSFLLLEGFLRIFIKEPLSGWYGYPPGLIIPDETKGYKYNPGFRGFFPNVPYDKIAININSKGLRDDEHSYEKPEGTIRILGLGDSVTFGSGVDYKGTYLKQLEEKLNSQGYKIEVIKAGVNSYEFDQEYSYYFEEGYKYNPDVVIIGVVLNDMREMTPQLIEEQYNLHKKITEDEKLNKKPTSDDHSQPIIWRYCRTCNILYDILRAWETKNDRNEYNLKYFEENLKVNWEKDWERYEAKLIHMDEKLRNENVKLVLVVFPYAEQLTHAYDLSKLPQKRLAKLSSIIFIDLLPYLDKPDYKNYFLGGDSIHLNEEGYKITSDVISKELINKGIIKANK